MKEIVNAAEAARILDVTESYVRFYAPEWRFAKVRHIKGRKNKKYDISTQTNVLGIWHPIGGSGKEAGRKWINTTVHLPGIGRRNGSGVPCLSSAPAALPWGTCWGTCPAWRWWCISGCKKG